MARKLLPNRISTQLTQEIMDAFVAKLKEARDLLPPTPVITDEELATWEKMGPGKREEARQTVPILKEHGSFLPPVLAMSHAETDLSLYDQLMILLAENDRIIVKDLGRLQTIGGGEGLNVIRLAEEKAYSEATLGNEDAIKAVNAIEKLPRSSDKKPAKSTKTSSPTPK